MDRRKETEENMEGRKRREEEERGRGLIYNRGRRGS